MFLVHCHFVLHVWGMRQIICFIVYMSLDHENLQHDLIEKIVHNQTYWILS